jgi:hypothetical protein
LNKAGEQLIEVVEEDVDVHNMDEAVEADDLMFRSALRARTRGKGKRGRDG